MNQSVRVGKLTVLLDFVSPFCCCLIPLNTLTINVIHILILKPYSGNQHVYQLFSHFAFRHCLSLFINPPPFLVHQTRPCFRYHPFVANKYLPLEAGS